MSVSLWNYEPWKCDGRICIGDCDYCDQQEEAEQDGDITWECSLYDD